MKYFQFIFWTHAFLSDRDSFDYDIFADKLSEAKKIAFRKFRRDFKEHSGLNFPLLDIDDTIYDCCEVKCKASS